MNKQRNNKKVCAIWANLEKVNHWLRVNRTAPQVLASKLHGNAPHLVEDDACLLITPMRVKPCFCAPVMLLQRAERVTHILQQLPGTAPCALPPPKFFRRRKSFVGESSHRHRSIAPWTREHFTRRRGGLQVRARRHRERSACTHSP